MERAKSDSVGLGSGAPPLCGKLYRVLFEHFFRVNAVPGKGAAAEMMNEQVACDRQLEAGAAGALGEVVVVEESKPELLVEPTDRFVNSPPHEDAKP
jgi:hypothetical protein